MSVTAPVLPMPATGPIAPVQSTLPVSNKVNLSDVARQRGMSQAWSYYKGQFKKSLPIRRGAVDDNVNLNYCRNIVDKGVAFLFGKEPIFSEAHETAEQTPAEKFLAEVWEANKKMTLLAKIATQGGVTGHVFVKLAQGRKYPRIILLDTQNITVQTDPSDVEEVLSYTIEYKAPVAGESGFHRQVISRIDTEASYWTIADWERTVREVVWRPVGSVEWPYEWSPVLDCQNIPLPNEFYGLPDLPVDILSLNDSINLSATNIARILKHHANPKTWGRGFRAQQVESNVDNFLIIPSDTAEVKNLEMHSDLSASLKFLEELEVEMHEASRMPEIALGKVERLGAITGVALAVLHSPLIEKTELKQGTYGQLLIDICNAVLEMGGIQGVGKISVAWPKMLPSDPLAERQAAILDKNLGVSQETILGTLGYDPVVEQQRTLGEAILAANTQAALNPSLPGGAATPDGKLVPPDGATPNTPRQPKAGADGVLVTTPNSTIDSTKIAAYRNNVGIAGNGRQPDQG